VVSHTENALLKALWRLLLISLLLFPVTAHAIELQLQQGLCAGSEGPSSECDDGQPQRDGMAIPQFKESKAAAGKKEPAAKNPALPGIAGRTAGSPGEYLLDQKSVSDLKPVVVFFWGKGCPHCEQEKIFLADIKAKYPALQIRDYEVWFNKENAQFLKKTADAYGLKTVGVPVTFVDEEAFVGFTAGSKSGLEDAIRSCLSRQCIDPSDRINKRAETKPAAAGDIRPVPRVTEIGAGASHSGSTDKTEANAGKDNSLDVPFIGRLDISDMSLPLITIVIAGLDSFNPCAFFVLFSLLGLLVYAQSRSRMFLIGGIFVFFSGFIYFLFMSAWLNFFLIAGQVALVTKIAGVVSVVIAGINIKDFFAFKKGVSLSIPESAKPKLFDRMRRLLKSTSLLSIIAGTAVLAIAANSYELLCTAGFPMVFTRILTLNNLPTRLFYVYLVLYNIVYVIPLLAIVIVFSVTLDRRKLTEREGRVLKLASGTMMLGLGLTLFFNPALLNNIKISLLILGGACVVSACIVLLTRRHY